MLSRLFSILPFRLWAVGASAAEFPFPLVHSGTLPPPVPREPGDDLPAMVCRAVFEEMSIHANGDITCSCADPTGRRVYGNVYLDRIGDVYNGPMYCAIRDWQLNSKPNCWCPVIQSNCAGRVARASAVDTPVARQVKMLQLEPVSLCNLRCPDCPVTTHFPAPQLSQRRNQMLPLDTLLDIVDQLPHLEIMLFYNFGEPFLHRDAVPFLREVKRRRPDIFIACSTNGLAFSPSVLEAIATEALLNRLVFAIDGASAETYQRYRIGGDFSKAMRNFETMVSLSDGAGTRGKMEIIWQYILFEWNDSDKEIARAKKLARNIGIPINWILTHTPGASKRYLVGSSAFEDLYEDHGTTASLTCEVQLNDFLQNDRIAKGRYMARISTNQPALSAPAGGNLKLDLTIENLSRVGWTTDNPEGFHLGVMLRDPVGKKLHELPGYRLPDTVNGPGGRGNVSLELILPTDPGDYQLLIDIVEGNICWFFERGSQPLICPLTVKEEETLPTNEHE